MYIKRYYYNNDLQTLQVQQKGMSERIYLHVLVKRVFSSNKA
jgi:hypothetical protein